MKVPRNSALLLATFVLVAASIRAEDRAGDQIEVTSHQPEIIEMLRRRVSDLKDEIADLRAENTELSGQVPIWQKTAEQKDVEIELYKVNLREKQTLIDARKEQVDLLAQSLAQREELMKELAKRRENTGGNSARSYAWLKFAESIPTVAAIVAMGMASHN